MSPGWTSVVPGTIEGRLATDGSRVFVATHEGTVRALSRLSGAVLLEVTGRSGQIAARSDLLVLRESDGTVWSMDPATGEARWKVESNVPGQIAPTLFENVVLIAGTGAAALRVKDGKAMWASTEGTATSLPVGHGPHVYVGEQDGTLRCRDAATGSTLWALPTASTLVSPVIVDDRQSLLLGTTDRRFVALHADKGTTRWTWRLGADVHMPPAVFEGLVLFTTHEDVLYALNRRNGHLQWRASLPSRPLSGPLLHQGSALVACYGARPGETFVVGFDAKTGKRLGDLKAPGELQSAPLLLDERIILPLRPERTALSEVQSGVTAMILGSAEGPAVTPSPSPSPSPAAPVSPSPPPP
jgi:outer membrane protein assembly factor BamB